MRAQIECTVTGIPGGCEPITVTGNGSSATNTVGSGDLANALMGMMGMRATPTDTAQYRDDTEIVVTAPRLHPIVSSPIFVSGGMPLTPAVTCVGGNCDEGVVITSKSHLSEKWVLQGGRYRLNPSYTSPWYDIGLDGFLKFQLGGYALATSPVVADYLFAGQRVGILNNNRYLRVGLGPGKGATQNNYWESFRIAVGKGNQTSHFDIWPR